MKDILVIIQNSLAIFFGLVVTIGITSVGCSAQQTNEQALRSLRDLTKSGKMPAESVVEDIERRFRGTETAALARLLRARIKFDNKDFAGAAALLESNEIAEKTKLDDYALWLRGRSLQSVGDSRKAAEIFAKLVKDHPDSIHAKPAKFAWAETSIQAGSTGDEIANFLKTEIDDHAPNALLLTAKAYETRGDALNATRYYRQTFFYGAGSDAAKQAEAKIVAGGGSLLPTNAEEGTIRASKLLEAKKFVDAEKAYNDLLLAFPAASSEQLNFDRMMTAVGLKKMPAAQTIFFSIPASSAIKSKAYYELTTAYAKNRVWPSARQFAEEMRAKHANDPLTVKAWVDSGYAARDAKNKGEENYFLRTALINYPAAVEVAGAQFELAWLEHEAGNNAKAADMLIEHLARYAAKDSSNRGRAGYWSARNAEKAGRIAEACVLYDALVYRYSANWYGHIGFERLTALRNRGECQSTTASANNTLVAQAAAALRMVTVAPETAGPREVERAEKSEQLSAIGLFDWSIDELKAAQKTAQNSPRINLALAKHYRMRSDNVNALLALAKSYPDYAQMFPEEMGRDEWDIFYPHVAWDQIKTWAKNRDLEIYLVAGLIRQESVFNPTARSPANAYGLMQLLLPTAKLTARKNGTTAPLASASELYQPALNIELGTAYMKEQLVKFGRVEFMAVAYNAGPGRVPQWQARLPLEMDEFVEAIPFRETKGYVQGIIRNRAQYRRLYDEDGNFKPNVGTKPLRGEIDTKPREQFVAEFPEINLAGDKSAE